MLLGLASVLQLRIVVFSSIDSWPYFIIHPQTEALDGPPILLAYLQAGPGHYSLAVKRKDSEAIEQVSHIDNVDCDNNGSKSHCRCGRGRNTTNTQRLNCSKNQIIFPVVLVFGVEYTAHLTASVKIVIISL